MDEDKPKPRKPLPLEKLRELEAYVTNFIDKNGFTASECIYQSDEASLDGPEFIDSICQIIGYTEYSP